MHIYFNAEGLIKVGKNKKMTWDAKTMLPLSRAAVSVASFWILVSAHAASARDDGMLEDARASVLLINVDDWNDWNQVLRGHPQASTPHIDRLAKKGVTFSHAICASPVCFPSFGAAGPAAKS